INRSGSIKVETTKTGQDTVLSGIIKMVEDAMDRGLSSEEAQDNIRFKDYFPDAPDDEFLRPMRRMMIAHLYEELTKNRRKQSG
ncbi:MAG: hypothetical protein NUV31_06025, partial [Dehalococcoidales bacterium]|nr:hypothetical protein [Dehalococcoidales bacterium]